MSSTEELSDHGLEVLKKAAHRPDDSKKSVYTIRTSEAISSLNIPIPQQFDDTLITYDVTSGEVGEVKYYYQTNLLRTVTISYESYVSNGLTLYRPNRVQYT